MTEKGRARERERESGRGGEGISHERNCGYLLLHCVEMSRRLGCTESCA